MDKKIEERLLEDFAALMHQYRLPMFGVIDARGEECPTQSGGPSGAQAGHCTGGPFGMMGFHRGPMPGSDGTFDGRPAAGFDRAGQSGDHAYRMPGHGIDRRPPMARERVLRIIGMEEGISQKKLSMLLGIRPQSLSELLGKLVKDGYITRRQNEQDKRETLVFLTGLGRERSEEVEQMRAHRTGRLFSTLTPEEKETLLALLEKLLNRKENCL